MQNFKYETGDWRVTKYEQVFEDVDVHVMQTTQLNGHTIHYKNASVTEEKDISIDGKPYKALVIESELWIQAGFETTYAADNEKWRKYHQNFNDKIQDKAQKSLVKSGFLNEEGYNVSHLVEWFVPGIGIVKTICYDSIGCISSISVWDSVK